MSCAPDRIEIKPLLSLSHSLHPSLSLNFLALFLSPSVFLSVSLSLSLKAYHFHIIYLFSSLSPPTLSFHAFSPFPLHTDLFLLLSHPPLSISAEHSSSLLLSLSLISLSLSSLSLSLSHTHTHTPYLSLLHRICIHLRQLRICLFITIYEFNLACVFEIKCHQQDI